MATEIVFGNGNSIKTNEAEPADLAQALSGNKDKNKFAGNYLHLATSDNKEVWVNPAQIVYLTRA